MKAEKDPEPSSAEGQVTERKPVQFPRYPFEWGYLEMAAAKLFNCGIVYIDPGQA